MCEIYTDVDGVFTASPRIVSDARLLEFIGYDEMLEFAASGSHVLHPRCVEIASKYDIPLEVRSSFHHRPGTTVVRKELLEKVAITGVTGDAEIARIALMRVKDIPGVAARISKTLADANVHIQLIIQGIRHDQTNDFSLIISQEDAQHSQEILERVSKEVEAQEIQVDTHVARVSVIGSGVASNPGVAARMFQALADNEINIQLISSSEIRIACIILEDQLDSAIRALHEAFDLSNLERKQIPTT